MENSSIIQKVLQITKENLEFFIETVFIEIYGEDKFIIYLNNSHPEKKDNIEMMDYNEIKENYNNKFKDISYFINIFLKYWEGIFKQKLIHNYVLTLIHSIRYFRNKWAHQSHMNERELYRFVDECQSFLEEMKINDENFIKNLNELNFIRLNCLEKLVYAEMNKNHFYVNNNNNILNETVSDKNDNFSNISCKPNNFENINKNAFIENENFSCSLKQGNCNYQLNQFDNQKFENDMNQNYNNEEFVNFYNKNNNQTWDSNCFYGNYSDFDQTFYNSNLNKGLNILNNLRSEEFHENQYNYNMNSETGNNDKKNLNNFTNIVEKNNAKISNKFFNTEKTNFEEDKQMQEYDKIILNNKHYDKLIHKNLQNKNNHFNVYVHSEDEN